MSCYRPIRGFRTPDGVVFSELERYDILGDAEVPCGQCVGCRMRRASDWSLRVMHEASLYDANCFVTLTYAPGNLSSWSLVHDDFAAFMKRLRFHFRPRPIRFFMCGEYGELHRRPHFHACLFNVEFRSDSKPAGKSASGFVYYSSDLLNRLWSKGRAVVQPLTRETAEYTSRYILKKVTGDLADANYRHVDEYGEISQLTPEYAAMSLKQGIGYEWFQRYWRDVFPHDFVVFEGKKFRPPRYYDKLLTRLPGITPDIVQQARVERARLSAVDNTDERRAVREAVHLAKVRQLSRSIE